MATIGGDGKDRGERDKTSHMVAVTGTRERLGCSFFFFSKKSIRTMMKMCHYDQQRRGHPSHAAVRHSTELRSLSPPHGKVFNPFVAFLQKLRKKREGDELGQNHSHLLVQL